MTTTANVGFEKELFKMADKLRNNMDAGEYKHIVLGLIFLKYISDKFNERYEKLVQEGDGFEEDKDEYIMDNIFWVPKESRWQVLRDNANSPEIGKLVDNALLQIEKENNSLKGVMDKRYAKPDLDKTKLGELITLITNVSAKYHDEKDLMGRVYEYFLNAFADITGGEFYTPTSVVKTIVEMIEPYKGRVYDPACGSGGMFIQSGKFIQEHSQNINNISIYGQESNPTTWRLCKMNLAIRGLDGNLGAHHADSFHNDLHKNLKADFAMANPPFNISDWGGERLKDDDRWQWGIPPVGNANYAWLSHILTHLGSRAGLGAVVLANGSLSSNTSNEGNIRRAMIEDDKVDAIVALPDKLFYSTGIPVCLWILSQNKSHEKHRDRTGETLFIDARNLGEMVTRKHRELSEKEIKSIADTYHAYKSKEGNYKDIKGFCKRASLEEIQKHDYVLIPGRYVGIAQEEDDGIPFEEKMTKLSTQLKEQFEKSNILEKQIKENLKGLGYEIN
ncbi:type I restriction-modification system subunit M [Halarcobacter ebronensis]|uniref:site-specific DNA-methyltransferase (adenine-specific) n=1 Tax=Halarcobacter ebronensis TaxID=1462615 RepID=A0A4Q1AXM3_9BACT|nr:class I SAM-dependent DNA methyltransferase [Halarcobacter ebronensis]QKF83365.1 type I restriction/modification system, methylation subunit [Halarcobacter ebronensis]RXK05925.1 N-6 DNA methylase [Halarcobacter ebronensis]